MSKSKKKVVGNERRIPPKGFQKLQHIGSGAFGDVYLVRKENDGKRFVCKVERLPSSHGHSREVRILRDLGKHERIIDLYAFVDEPYNCQMILGYCAGGDLRALIWQQYPGVRSFSEAFIHHIFLQLAEALAYIHKGVVRKPNHVRLVPSHWSPVIHRDIKPENVLLRTPYPSSPFPQLVLGDFGCATTQTTSSLWTTPKYQPPEMPLWSSKGDVWSVGAIIHTLGHGFEPVRPKPKDASDSWYTLPGSKKVFPLSIQYSSGLDRAMGKALATDPDRRFKTLELLDELIDL